MSYKLSACVLAILTASAAALQCYQCGQYNDGIGSITPCINETHMELKECPSLDHVYCIVSTSEGGVVDGRSQAMRNSCFCQDSSNGAIEMYNRFKAGLEIKLENLSV